MARSKWGKQEGFESGDWVWAIVVGALVFLVVLSSILVVRLNRIEHPAQPEPTPMVVVTPEPTPSPTPIDPSSTPTPMANDPMTRGTGE